jgi:hypothetical protein
LPGLLLPGCRARGRGEPPRGRARRKAGPAARGASSACTAAASRTRPPRTRRGSPPAARRGDGPNQRPQETRRRRRKIVSITTLSACLPGSLKLFSLKTESVIVLNPCIEVSGEAN